MTQVFAKSCAQTPHGFPVPSCFAIVVMIIYRTNEVGDIKHMALTRFSVSLDEALVRQFDAKIKTDRCPTRSKAVGDLIRSNLVQTEWRAGDEVAGAIVLVYDHHKRDILQRLTDVQHDCHDAIISTQHVHLDHDNCLEIVAVRGSPTEIEAILKRLKAVKGLKHVSLAAGTTGQRLS